MNHSLLQYTVCFMFAETGALLFNYPMLMESDNGPH
jgi:hypothetical protein